MDSNEERDDGIVYRSFPLTNRSVDMKARTVDVIMSTDMVDRYGERVEQDWDLTSYAGNPTVLWAHNSKELPIGRTERVRVAGGDLQGTIHFASVAGNPKGEQCLQLFNEGVLNAVSVGFIPHSQRIEIIDDIETLVFSKNELVELSVTPTPANPEALAKMRARAMRETPKPPQQQSLPIEGANKEPDMDTKELEDKIKALELSAGKSADAMATTTKALETANAKLVELTAALATSDKSLLEEKAKNVETEKRAKAAEAAVIKAGVEALVGKKITPAEVEEYIELATENPALYAKMIAKKADMTLAAGAVVVGSEKGIPTPPTSIGVGDDALASIIDKQNNFAPLESYGAEDVIQDN